MQAPEAPHKVQHRSAGFRLKTVPVGDSKGSKLLQ